MDTLKVGLALGSGSARGMAHIGVLKALEENNINVDIIAGCSIGALIGSLYCSGIDPKTIENIAIQIKKSLWMDFTVPRRGLIKGDKVEEIIKLLTRNRCIEDLDKKFAAVATDLKKAQRYVFTNGPICRAVRASISIPGVFVPVKCDNMILVDGGVTDRVPVSVAKEMGADVVIAVDVGFTTQQGKISHVIDVILQSIDVMAKQILDSNKPDADVLIEPSLSHIGPSKFEDVLECSNIGYQTTLDKIDEIKMVTKKNIDTSFINK